MRTIESCPLCKGSGFIKVSTGQNPSGEWAARMKCEECKTEIICYGATEDDALLAVLKVWNTRAERTCTKVPGKMHYGERRPKCSECGYGLGDSRWGFCPSCGARVVEP